MMMRGASSPWRVTEEKINVSETNALDDGVPLWLKKGAAFYFFRDLTIHIFEKCRLYIERDY